MLAKGEVLSLDSQPMKKLSKKYGGQRHHYDGRAANKAPDRGRTPVPPVIREHREVCRVCINVEREGKRKA